MSRLLVIQSSPRTQRSKSNLVADAFVEVYRTHNPEDEIEVINLSQLDLPILDEATLNAKYAIMHGQLPSDEDMEHWAGVEDVIVQFMAGDKFLFATPMWNFSLPYYLKHFLDVIIQPTYTFAYNEDEGYRGLVTGRPAAVIYARGGAYEGDYASLDMQKPYLEQVLGFMGIADIQSIIIEPTLMAGPIAAKQAIAAGVEKAKEIASGF